jgi:hypothetical protein
MRITGFRNYDWEPDGYYFHIDPENTFVPSVEPTVIYRTGTWSTFGIPQIGPMIITGAFGMYSGGAADLLPPDEAWQNLFRRLEPSNVSIGEIRGTQVRAAGEVPVEFMGFLQLPNASSLGDIKAKNIAFYCGQPFFEGQLWLSGGGVI